MPPASARPVLARRLVVVTGKGGVGKSTVAAALAVAASRAGRRTAVVEVGGRTDVAAMLGLRRDAREPEAELEPRLHHVTVDARTAMAEYLRREVPGRVPGVVLARSRAFDLFAQATPGLRELVTIGKVWELAQRPRHARGARPYDLVVLDAPATGHALALLGAPRTFATLARVGPVARQGAAIAAELGDARRTALVAVATPEQMAVTELLGLAAPLRDLGMELDAIVVNRVVGRPLAAADAAALAAAPDDDPAVRSARWLDARARAQAAQAARLRRGAHGVPETTLPFDFAGAVARPQIGDLAGRLARWLA